jgi:hypothetical protein
MVSDGLCEWEQEPGTSKLNCPSADFIYRPPSPDSPELQVLWSPGEQGFNLSRFQWMSLAKTLSNFISSGAPIN